MGLDFLFPLSEFSPLSSIILLHFYFTSFFKKFLDDFVVLSVRCLKRNKRHLLHKHDFFMCWLLTVRLQLASPGFVDIKNNKFS